MTKSKMHISHIQGAVAFVSMMHKAIPVQSVRWGQTDAFSEAVMGIFKVHRLKA